MATTPVRNPVPPGPFTWIGQGLGVLAVVPSPSCPDPLAPQLQTVPLDVSASECAGPPATATTSVNGTPGDRSTWTGVRRWSVVPSPSCPLSFRPQAHAVPSGLTARVWVPPAPIAPVIR